MNRRTPVVAKRRPRSSLTIHINDRPPCSPKKDSDEAGDAANPPRDQSPPRCDELMDAANPPLSGQTSPKKQTQQSSAEGGENSSKRQSPNGEPAATPKDNGYVSPKKRPRVAHDVPASPGSDDCDPSASPKKRQRSNSSESENLPLPPQCGQGKRKHNTSSTSDYEDLGALSRYPKRRRQRKRNYSPQSDSSSDGDSTEVRSSRGRRGGKRKLSSKAEVLSDDDGSERDMGSNTETSDVPQTLESLWSLVSGRLLKLEGLEFDFETSVEQLRKHISRGALFLPDVLTMMNERVSEFGAIFRDLLFWFCVRYLSQHA